MNRDIKLKVGQRWEYNTPNYHFIVEISSENPITCSTIQSFAGDYRAGYVTSSWKPHEVEGGSWHYLVGQDRPI